MQNSSISLAQTAFAPASSKATQKPRKRPIKAATRRFVEKRGFLMSDEGSYIIICESVVNSQYRNTFGIVLITEDPQSITIRPGTSQTDNSILL